MDSQHNRTEWSSGPLGALRSELDEGSDIADAFTMLESCASAVRYAYVGRRITPTAAAELFAELRLSGTDGAMWTVGASSNSWYRKTGTRWEPSAPPFGIEPSGALPGWTNSGIGGLISAAEQQMTAAQAPAAVDTQDDTSTAPADATPKQPADPTSFALTGNPDDVDWVLAEWSNPAAPAPLRGEPRIGGVGLPEQIPTTWQPGRAVSDGIDALTGTPSAPAPRVGAGAEYRDALDEELEDSYTLPQDFFLPPEDRPGA